MNPIECSACSEFLLGFCWQRSFAFMSMSTCVCEGVCERNDINSTIVCDKPFATHTSVHTHTLECPPLTPSYTLPTVLTYPESCTHTHLDTQTHNPPSWLFVFIFHLCFLLNLHSYQSLYCFCSKVICHNLCGHRNSFSSVDVLSRQCTLLRKHSYDWGGLYFCRQSFSL